MSTYINPFDNDNLHQYEYKGVIVQYGNKLAWLKNQKHFNLTEFERVQQEQKDGIFDIRHQWTIGGFTYAAWRLINTDILTPDYKQYVLDKMEQDIKSDIDQILKGVYK